MAPQQHLVISWVIANLGGWRRGRIVATFSGLIPDIDGLGLLWDRLVGDDSYTYYMSLHHKAGHNLFALAAVVIGAFFLCKRKILPAIISGAVFLCHLFCDYIGSGSEEGDIWSILPFWPANTFELSTTWQWSLNDWRNTLITAMFLLAAAVIIAKKNRSFLEVFSVKLDQYCIRAVKQVFSIGKLKKNV